MSSKRLFSWSKRQSSPEPYYRTGGLLPIVVDRSENGNSFEAKTTPNIDRRRPSNLRIVLPDNDQFTLSPVSAQYNAALVSAASNLQSVFNDMLRSPVPSAAVCARSVSLQKPLPRRPRSICAPSTPELPAELPGSLLQNNQGFPSYASPAQISSQRQASPPIVRGSTVPNTHPEEEEDQVQLASLIPEPLIHAKSVPDLSQRHSAMRPVQSGNALNSSTATRPNPLKVQHKKSLSETSQGRSKPQLVTTPLSIDSKLTSCSSPERDEGVDVFRKTPPDTAKPLQPSPLIVEGNPRGASLETGRICRYDLGAASTPAPKATRSKQIAELKATISTQDHTISTLQAQFASLRSSHETHVASLVDTHLAEVASLRNYASVLEEHLAQKPSLHHASSNNLLFRLDTTEPPQTPSRETPQDTAGTTSASSITSFQSALEKQQRSPQHSRNSPEMENLKRRLSSTRRPETANRNLLPELNQYKQNNVALQKQIESLMAKLNESKKNERQSRVALEAAEQKCTERDGEVIKAASLAKSVQALQNTIDHLESRLEAANIERLDAEEQLFNLRIDKSPFDAVLSKLQIPVSDADEKMAAYDAHMSMSTVFSSASPVSQDNDSSTLAAFVTHIERLQDQVRQKDAHIIELERERNRLQQEHSQLTQEHAEVSLQSDIQNELLRKTQQTDTHIQQLRVAILDREVIIGEKENSMRVVERQLDQHKLLLQAEIRRHATMKLNIPAEHDPIPELTSLAKREDIDKWINKLHQRLNQERLAGEGAHSMNPKEVQVESLQQEIDFYVREIIYYKLDIRGYKSDIRKLKKITTQLSSYGSRASDLDSETSSLRPIATPSRSRFASATPELGAPSSAPPNLTGPIFISPMTARPLTPTLSRPALNSFTPPDSVKPADNEGYLQQHLPPRATQVSKRDFGFNLTNELDIIEQSLWPESGVKLLPEGSKPGVSSSDQDSFGELLTNLPPGNSAIPQRQDTQRSMSESLLLLYTAPRTPEQLVIMQSNGLSAEIMKAAIHRGRSASAPDAVNSKSTPERPHRPRFGLFRFSSRPTSTTNNPPPAPHVDVLAEAIHQTSEPVAQVVQSPRQRANSNSSSVRVVAPSFAQDMRDRTATSPPPISPAIIRPRAGSTASSTGGHVPIQSPTTPERKLSVASNVSIPFVIAMGSPHNPALTSPTTSLAPVVCSITRNAPLKINSAVGRTGVGGTMASSTPITSPVSPTDTSRPEPLPKPLPPKPLPPKPTNLTSGAPTRKPSLRSKTQVGETRQQQPRTPSHSRNASGNSIRTAIRLPKTREKDKEEMHRVRKGSISLPKPLGSPFSLGRSLSLGSGGRNDGEGRKDAAPPYGIGEAI